MAGGACRWAVYQDPEEQGGSPLLINKEQSSARPRGILETTFMQLRREKELEEAHWKNREAINRPEATDLYSPEPFICF